MRYPLVPKSRLTTLVLFVGIAFLQVGANEAQAQSRVGVKNYDDQGRFVAASDDQALSPRYIDHGLAKKLVAEPAAVSEPVAEPVEADLYGEHTDGVLASAPSTTTSSGLCGTSENRVGFNGYRYDCELGLYYTPSGRTYDPKIGRFIQQDSYLGDILNPPSLHRYTYGHNNPTSFVDPTGHESYRQWIGLDKPTPSFWHEFGKNIAYRSFNFVSLGTLGRQDRLVEQFEAGKIADEQYGRRTAINAGTGAVVLGAAVVTGGAAAGATGVVASAGGLTAAEVTLASGVSAGGFGALGAQTANDLMELHGTRTKEVGDIQTSDYVAAFGLGAATGPLASGVGNPSLPSFRGLDNPVTSGLVGTIEAAGQYAYEGGANAARALIVVEGGSGPVLVPATGDPVQPAPSTGSDRTYITYVLKNSSGEVVYVGRASGVGTPEQVLQQRLSKGHDVFDAHPELTAEVSAVQGSALANKGAEGVLYEQRLREGASLLNDPKSPPLSSKPDKAPEVRAKIDAYHGDLKRP